MSVGCQELRVGEGEIFETFLDSGAHRAISWGVLDAQLQELHLKVSGIRVGLGVKGAFFNQKIHSLSHS